MARKRKSSRRFFFRRKAHRSSRSSGSSVVPLVVGTTVYSAARSRVMPMVQSFQSKVPVIQNLPTGPVLGIAAYLMSKRASGMVRTGLQSVALVEANKVGESVSGGASSPSNTQWY